MPFDRYHTASGSHPNIQAAFFLQGPQAEDQILTEVKQLLDRPGVKYIAVVFDHGNGEIITTYQPIRET